MPLHCLSGHPRDPPTCAPESGWFGPTTGGEPVSDGRKGTGQCSSEPAWPFWQRSGEWRRWMRVCKAMSAAGEGTRCWKTALTVGMGREEGRQRTEGKFLLLSVPRRLEDCPRTTGTPHLTIPHWAVGTSQVLTTYFPWLWHHPLLLKKKKNDSIPNLGSKLAPLRETKTWAIAPPSGKQKEGP